MQVHGFCCGLVDYEAVELKLALSTGNLLESARVSAGDIYKIRMEEFT